MKYLDVTHQSRRNILTVARVAAVAFAMGWSSLGLANDIEPTEPVMAVVTVDNQVNINTADAATLSLALDGVGMTRAADIIAYREQHGSFESVEDLGRVRGIGPATLERNRDRILLSDSAD